MEVTLENISFQTEKEIIKNINLTIEDKKITSFIGKEGSGKTTILELIAALKKPTKGKIKIGEIIVNNKTIKGLRPEIGLVYQNPEKQFFNETIKEELEFALQTGNYNPKEHEKRMSDALKLVGLNESYINRSPFELSKGEQRKLAIALVLAFNPKIIVLDEPTKDLDSQSRKHIIKLLKLMKLRYHKTIIIATKDTDMLLELSDTIHLINEGQIIKSGDKYQILSDHKLLDKHHVETPKTIGFSHLVKEKANINIGYRDEINDLMKDIYRYVK